jgi:hypothetical protein
MPPEMLTTAPAPPRLFHLLRPAQGPPDDEGDAVDCCSPGYEPARSTPAGNGFAPLKAVPERQQGGTFSGVTIEASFRMCFLPGTAAARGGPEDLLQAELRHDSLLPAIA